MQFLCSEAKIFFLDKFFGPQIVEKTTLKSCTEKLKSTFFPCCLDSPNSQNRRIHVPKCAKVRQRIFTRSRLQSLGFDKVVVVSFEFEITQVVSIHQFERKNLFAKKERKMARNKREHENKTSKFLNGLKKPRRSLMR